MDRTNSPTLYSQITGKYASVGSKIFPHILLLCSISYSCFNGLIINQHVIKPLQGEKCTSYLSVVDLSIVLPQVFFFAAPCGRTNVITVTLTCTNANETVAIDVLVVVYNKTWENRVMLSLHGQLVLDIRPRCWLRMLKFTRLRLVNFYHPQSTSLPNIQHYLIMTRWITLHYFNKNRIVYTSYAYTQQMFTQHIISCINIPF